MQQLPISGDEVLALIPQRPPIVMVDSLLEFDTNSAKTSILIETENLFVQDREFVEGGLLEHMAQSVAMHTGYDFYIKGEQAPTGYIGAIQKAEIIALPKVGDVVESHVSILQEFMGVTLVDITCFIEGRQIAYAQMKTVVAADKN